MRYARVFADLLNEVRSEPAAAPAAAAKGVADGGLAIVGGSKAMSTRDSVRHHDHSGAYFDVTRDELEDMGPKLQQTIKTTLRDAKQSAAAELRRKTKPHEAAPREVRSSGGRPEARKPPPLEWAKFVEPMSRCRYFVSSKTGESRWAAHFDEDVMVVEGLDGTVGYVHSVSGRKVEGPKEETHFNTYTAWSTLVDPVSGQVYYYSHLSEESRWDCPVWIDYYAVEHHAVYYVNTVTDESTWDEPPGFRKEAGASFDEFNRDHFAKTVRRPTGDKENTRLAASPLPPRGRAPHKPPPMSPQVLKSTAAINRIRFAAPQHKNARSEAKDEEPASSPPRASTLRKPPVISPEVLKSTAREAKETERSMVSPASSMSASPLAPSMRKEAAPLKAAGGVEEFKPFSPPNRTPVPEAKGGVGPLSPPTGGGLNDILYSYAKRPKTPWVDYGKFAETSRGDPGARCGKLPIRELRFGDTIVLSDMMGLD